MTTLIYTRFSPRPDAAEAQSLVVQEAVCRRYADLRELPVLEVIGDPETSARLVSLRDREGGKRLFAMVDSGHVENIICQKIDRMFRDTEDGLGSVRWMMKRGVGLHFADQGGNSIDASTSYGFLMFTMFLGVATFEAMNGSERTSGSMRHQQESGLAMGSRPPYGKRIVQGPWSEAKKKFTMLLEDEPDEQAVIPRVLELRSLGLGPCEIATRLNAAGIPARGSKWHHSTVKSILERAG